MPTLLPKWARQVASILAYSACSISMTLANKHLVSHLGFYSHILLLALQSTAAVVTYLIGFRVGLIHDLNHPNWDLARKWLPVNLCFVAMLYTSFRALGVLSMPIVTIFKNLTNIGITAGAWYLFGERVGIMLLGALLILVMGAVLAGFADLRDVASTDPSSVEGADEDSILDRLTGYAWMLLNCFTTATYVLYLRAAADFKDMSRQDQAFYNNAMAIPLSFLLSLLMGELPGALSAEQMSWPTFWIAVLFSGSVGFFLSLASLWCVSETGATTYSMVGALNKIPLSLIGLLVFDAAVKPSTIIFMAFGLTGGVIFAYVKTLEAQAARAREAADKEVEEKQKVRSGSRADHEDALPGAGAAVDQHHLLGGEGFHRDPEVGEPADGSRGVGVAGPVGQVRVELMNGSGSGGRRAGSPLGRYSAGGGNGSLQPVVGGARYGSRLEALRVSTRAGAKSGSGAGAGAGAGSGGFTPTTASEYGASVRAFASEEESAEGGAGTPVEEAGHEAEAHRRPSVAHAGEAGV